MARTFRVYILTLTRPHAVVYSRSILKTGACSFSPWMNKISLFVVLSSSAWIPEMSLWCFSYKCIFEGVPIKDRSPMLRGLWHFVYQQHCFKYVISCMCYVLLCSLKSLTDFAHMLSVPCVVRLPDGFHSHLKAVVCSVLTCSCNVYRYWGITTCMWLLWGY